MPDLSHAGIGDKVAVSTGYTYRTYTGVHTITKITPSGIILLDNGERYRSNGYPVGRAPHDTSFAEPLTDEVKAAIARQQHLSLLKRVEWEKLDDATLEQIVVLIKKEQKS